jgi:S1-C subfamily serine protease
MLSSFPENWVYAEKAAVLSGRSGMSMGVWRTIIVAISERKKRWAVLFLLVVLVMGLPVVVAACSGGNTSGTTGQSAATTAGGTELQADLASPAQDVLGAVYTSVVNIAVTGTAGGQSGIGSGVVYTSDGYILTNDHVVTLDGQLTSGQTITVTFSDGSQAPATIVGEDATKDIAAIKVAKTGLNPVTFGKSSDVQLAEWATVIGSPLDFRNSVTLGIVSGLSRDLQVSATQTLTGLLQIDTPISPGNSGGGCFDAQGRFIGMPEVYLPPASTGAENIGFAIPADTVATAAKTLTGK